MPLHANARLLFAHACRDHYNDRRYILPVRTFSAGKRHRRDGIRALFSPWRAVVLTFWRRLFFAYERSGRKDVGMVCGGRTTDLWRQTPRQLAVISFVRILWRMPSPARAGQHMCIWHLCNLLPTAVSKAAASNAVALKEQTRRAVLPLCPWRKNAPSSLADFEQSR